MWMWMWMKPFWFCIPVVWYLVEKYSLAPYFLPVPVLLRSKTLTNVCCPKVSAAVLQGTASIVVVPSGQVWKQFCGHKLLLHCAE